ncbi:hypothetical protein C5S42_00705 [Candidatus Methanomarinus sp.]|nr:hypothetical protein C5S42_00705 [ANME-2 cluster archaeon]
MALSNNQKIMIVGIFIAAIVAIWTTTYMYSPDLVHTSYNPPDVISSKPENALSFDLTNYGEKTGSYKLYLNSNEILFSSLKSYDLDDYQENIYLGHALPPHNNDHYIFYYMVNESNLKSNATVTFIYVDTSHLFKKEQIWTFYYKLDHSNKYQLINEKFEIKTTL